MVGTRRSFRFFKTKPVCNSLISPYVYLSWFPTFCYQQMKPLVFTKGGSGLEHGSVLLLIELDVFQTEKTILCNNLWWRLSSLEINSHLALKSSFCSLQISTDFTIKRTIWLLCLISKMFILSLIDCLHFTTKKNPQWLPLDYCKKCHSVPYRSSQILPPKYLLCLYRLPKVF